MEHSPLVSIITLTHNHEKYIQQCIESIIGQTYKHWELIIIDDGSSDRTPKILRKYALQNNRIKFIRHDKNYGIKKLYISYNEALKLVHGEYIAILEGDDYWHPLKLEKQVKLLENFPACVLCHTNAYIVGEKNRQIDYYGAYLKNAILTNKNRMGLLYILCFLWLPIASSVMIRRSVLDEIGGFKGNEFTYVIDYPTSAFLALKGQFCWIQDKLTYYRKHVNAASMILNNKRANELLGGLKNLQKYFERNIISLLDEDFLLNNWKMNREKIKRKQLESMEHIIAPYNISYNLLILDNKKQAVSYLLRFLCDPFNFMKNIKIYLRSLVAFIDILFFQGMIRTVMLKTKKLYEVCNKLIN